MGDISIGRGSFDETTELWRFSGCPCGRCRRSGGQRSRGHGAPERRGHMDRGRQLLPGGPAASDFPAQGKGRGHRGFFLRLPGVQCVRADHAQAQAELAAQCRAGFRTGLVQSKRGLADVPTRVLHRPGAGSRRPDPRRHVQCRLAERRIGGHRSRDARHQEPPATIEDAAKFYKTQAGIPVDKFLETAKSFAVDVKVRAAEAWSRPTASIARPP